MQRYGNAKCKTDELLVPLQPVVSDPLVQPISGQ
jgi:hypothetical protein